MDLHRQTSPFSTIHYQLSTVHYPLFSKYLFYFCGEKIVLPG